MAFLGESESNDLSSQAIRATSRVPVPRLVEGSSFYNAGYELVDAPERSNRRRASGLVLW
jgi:hypothetical protein